MHKPPTAGKAAQGLGEEAGEGGDAGLTPGKGEGRGGRAGQEEPLITANF